MNSFDHAMKYAKTLSKTYKSVDLNKAFYILSNSYKTTGQVAYKVLNKEDFLHWLREGKQEYIESCERYNIEPTYLNDYDDDYETIGKRLSV